MRPDQGLCGENRDDTALQFRSIASILILLIFTTAGHASQALPKQNITPELRQSWRKVLNWTQDCEEGFESPDGKWGGVRFYRIAPRVHLVEVTCARGAYQGSHSYFVWDERSSKPAARALEFVTYEAPRDTLEKTRVTELWGTTQFDPRTTTLIVENRFRGPGDCGSRAVYRITADGASLVEFRAKVACDGRYVDPRRWPRISLDDPPKDGASRPLCR